MIARLLVLSAVTVFSFSSFADNSAEMMRQLVSCGETNAAKHVSLMVVMGIAAVFSPKIQEDLKPYETAMDSAKSCADLDAAYVLIEGAFSKNTEMTSEQYFNSPDGKAQLEQLVAELKKIK